MIPVTEELINTVKLSEFPWLEQTESVSEGFDDLTK